MEQGKPWSEKCELQTVCELYMRVIQVEGHFISVSVETIVARLNQRKLCIQTLQDNLTYKTYTVYGVKLCQEKYKTDLAIELVKDLDRNVWKNVPTITLGLLITLPSYIRADCETFLALIGSFQPKLKFDETDCLEKHAPNCDGCRRHFCNINYSLHEFPYSSVSDSIDSELEATKFLKWEAVINGPVEPSQVFFN